MTVVAQGQRMWTDSVKTALPIGLPNAKFQAEQTLCSRCSAVDIRNAREASPTANRIRTARRLAYG